MNPRESSIDIYALIGKFREKVVGAFVKKVYDLGNDTIALQIHGPTAKFDMVISKRLGIYFGDEEKPAEASPFAMLLRKMLSERRIADLGQINFDRVVRMAFSSGQELILELFREGNIIITNGGVIEFASNPREWRNRKILKGEKYIPPSAVDPLAIADDEFLSIIRTSKGSPVQTIATRLNFGGELAEEVVERSGLKAVATADFNLAHVKTLRAALQSVLGEALLGRGYYYESKDYLAPIEFRSFGETPSKVYEDFNLAVADYIRSHPNVETQGDSNARRIASIRESIAEFEKRAKENAEKGKFIAEHFAALQKILKLAANGKAAQGLPMTIEGVTLESVDQASKKVAVSQGEITLDLFYNESIGNNMNRYYSLAKEYRSKISGAQKIIEEFDRKDRRGSTTIEHRKSPRRKREWFESYRWFFTSEGFLVIAGRDAKSNEKIVKKHLGQRDFYIHADVYGAPSTILKSSDKGTPSEISFREACQFAVSFSRAWAAGMTSASAYWVLPSQVSKTPESGEFVSTGSWIVRGKRNYIFNIELVLEIDLVELKGTEVPMIHPPFPTQKDTDSKKVVLRPGDSKRSEVAARVSEILGVSREEIEAILPPGGSTIVSAA